MKRCDWPTWWCWRKYQRKAPAAIVLQKRTVNHEHFHPTHTFSQVHLVQWFFRSAVTHWFLQFHISHSVLDVLVERGTELPTHHHLAVQNSRLGKLTWRTKTCRARRSYQIKWETLADKDIRRTLQTLCRPCSESSWNAQPAVFLVRGQGAQGCAKWAPHFQFTCFEGAPIVRLRAFKNLRDFLYSCIIIIMMTLWNLICFALCFYE